MLTKIVSSTEMLQTLRSLKDDDGSLALLYALAVYNLGERELFSSKEFIMFIEYGLRSNNHSHTSFLNHILTNWWLSLPEDQIDFQTAYQHATFYAFRDSISEKLSS